MQEATDIGARVDESYEHLKAAINGLVRQAFGRRCSLYTTFLGRRDIAIKTLGIFWDRIGYFNDFEFTELVLFSDFKQSKHGPQYAAMYKMLTGKDITITYQ